MSFYDKYMKYKKKYLELVGSSQIQHGGAMTQINYTIGNNVTKDNIINFIKFVGLELGKLIKTMNISNSLIYTDVKIYIESNNTTPISVNANTDPDDTLFPSVSKYIGKCNRTYNVYIDLIKKYNNVTEDYMNIHIYGDITTKTLIINIKHEMCDEFDYKEDYNKLPKESVVSFLTSEKFKKITNIQSISLYRIIFTILNIKGEYI